MKTKLIIIFLLIILVFPIKAKAIATNSSDIKYINIYFFSDNDCEDCKRGKEWLDKYSTKNKGINVEYLTIDKNQELYNQTREALKIKKNKEPLIIIGSNYFMGFNDKTQSKLSEAIDAYKEHEDYCEIISKIQNMEDVKDCLKQNKKIYKQEKGFSVFKLLIIIGIVGLLIGGYIIIRRKN